MKLRYRNLDEVPEDLRQFYAEEQDDDGNPVGYRHVELSDYEHKGAIEGLKSALTKERQNARAAAARVKELEALAESNDHPRIAELEAELEALRNDRSHEQTAKELSELKLDNALTAAIATARGNPELLAPMLRGRLELAEDGSVRVLDTAGHAMLDIDGSYVTVNAYVEGLRNNPKFAGAFVADVAGGGGGTSPNDGEGTSLRSTHHGITRRSQLNGPDAHKAFIKAYGREAYTSLSP